MVAKGRGKAGMEIYYLVDTEFQFGKTKKFWRWVVVIVA